LIDTHQFDDICFLDCNPVVNQELGEPRPIYKYDDGAFHACRIPLGVLRELCRRDEHALTGTLRTVDGTHKLLDVRTTNCAVASPPLCLNVYASKPQRVFLDDSIDAAVSRLSDHLSGVGARATVAHLD